MKKIIWMLLLVLFISGCGQDEVSKKISSDISSLGKVTMNSEEKILKIDEIYKNMTDKQKNHVKNYNVLLEAKETIEILKNEETEKMNAKIDEILSREEYQFTIKHIKELISSLKDSDSFKLVKVEYIKQERTTFNSKCTNIVYTANNGFGGVVKNSYIVDATDDGLIVNSYDDENNSQKYMDCYNENFVDGAILWKVQKLDLDLIQMVISKI